MVTHTTPRRNPRPAQRPVIAPVIPVRVADEARWQAALLRALAYAGEIEPLGTRYRPDGVEVSGARVASHSEPGVWRRVELLTDTRGQLAGGCDCPAREICWHLALAIDTAGRWPDGFTIVHQPALPAVETSRPCCPYCGRADGLGSVMRETNPRGWCAFWRCYLCGAHLGYDYELDLATLRRTGVPA